MQNLDKRIFVRANLMEGKLDLPAYDKFVRSIGAEYTDLADRMFKSMWNAYLRNKGSIALPYWSKKFDNAEVFNAVLISLADAGWITTKSLPTRNWAEASLVEEKLLTIVTPDELVSIRANNKFKKYILTDKLSIQDSSTKQNGKITDTGLVRRGFKLAGNTKFQYDTDYMLKYFEAISRNTTKSMEKIAKIISELGSELRKDGASYDTISVEILNYHIYNSQEMFTTGNNTNDSRGRAIKDALSKVFNPISNKDARSLLVIPEQFRQVATDEGVRAIHLFIAELLGFKSGTKFQKSCRGKRAYNARELHDLELESNPKIISEIKSGRISENTLDRLNKFVPKDKLIKDISKLTDDDILVLLTAEDLRAEEDRKDLHENIWLSRLYDELDSYYEAIENGATHKWTTPIELDASASMLQYEGILLGHRPFMEMTNLIGDMLSDPWAFDGIPRTQFKKAMTPKLYGSSQTCTTLWKNAKIDYTHEQVALFNEATKTGTLAVAEQLKEFIISCCNPKETMTVKIWNEIFTIKCNRFKNIGDITTTFDIYDSESKLIKTIHHTHTHKEADLEQFRRYFITLLIHNLDSQVADYVCERVYEEFQWIIDIHDAFIVCPEGAKLTRQVYAQKLNAIYVNRNKILSDYFESIGVGAESQAKWEEVMKVVVPFEGTFECSEMALK